MPKNINNLEKVTSNSLEVVIFDFDGVFTNNAVYVDQNGVETVACCRSDGLGLSRLRDLGLKLFIVSTEINPVVSVRAKKLNVECYQGVADKSVVVRDLCADLGVSLCNVMFVGNDINDIPAFKEVGVPVGVSDSFGEIFPYISYITNKAGGDGAVREICDTIFRLKKFEDEI